MTADKLRVRPARAQSAALGLRVALRDVMTTRTLLLAAMLLAALCVPTGEARAEFISTPVTTAYVGQPYVYEVVATGTGTVVITAPNGLPPWLSLVATGNGTATLSGTPGPGDTGAGIVLRSEDVTCRFFYLCYRYQAFDITIIQNRPPTVAAPGIPDQSATEGAPFSLDVSGAFSDPDGDRLTFTAAGLPPTFALRNGIVSGTPTLADAGNSPFEVVVTADDGRGGRVSDRFTLSVGALARADISLTSIAATPDPARQDDDVEWTFTVANEGPNTSGVVSLAIDLLGVPLSLGEHGCTADSSVERGLRLACEVGPIAAGETATFELSGRADEVGDLYVTAAVAPLGDQPADPAPGNNRGEASLSFGQQLQLEPAQTLEEPSVAAAGADVDGDGYDDVAVAAGADAPAALHLNLENPASLHPELSDALDERRGLSTAGLSIGTSAANTDVAFADIDNDGDLDVVVASGAGAETEVLANDGTGVLSSMAAFGASADTRAVAAADVNGDGFADVVLANAGANEVWLADGGGGFAMTSLPGSGGTSVDVVVVDADADGLPEIVFANADAAAAVHPNTGNGFGAPAAVQTGATSSVAAADFNADGYVDLVFGRATPAASGMPSNPVYSNDGAGGFTAAAELGASPTLDVLAEDFNGDGASDIVAVNATGAHQLFVNDGAGGFAQHPALLVSRGAVAAAAASIGRLKSMDVVLSGPDGTAVFFNDSRGNLGLGDVGRPVIELLGEEEITLKVESAYQDPGATAVDDVDGTVTPVVDNPVDTMVIGTYTVTYTAADRAGNAAMPVTRTVRVEAREASGGGGGGSVGLVLVVALLACAAARHALLRAYRLQSAPILTRRA